MCDRVPKRHIASATCDHNSVSTAADHGAGECDLGGCPGHIHRCSRVADGDIPQTHSCRCDGHADKAGLVHIEASDIHLGDAVAEEDPLRGALHPRILDGDMARTTVDEQADRLPSGARTCDPAFKGALEWQTAPPLPARWD